MWAEGNNGDGAGASVARPAETPGGRSASSAAAAPGAFPCGRIRNSRPTLLPALRWIAARLLLPLAILCVFAFLIVGGEVTMREAFPDMSTGMRHALLTLRAGGVAVAASTIVYLMMRRQHKRLAATAEQLSDLLKSYQRNPSAPGRFENPHLVHCRDVLECEHPQCIMFDSPAERCWQVMALSRTDGEHGPPRIEVQQCLACEVYHRSCPDRLTELGEAFNNLMFLLEAEARQSDRMRAQMVEKDKMVAIGQIAAGVAHEVGNPLSSISSIVQMLKRSRTRPSTTERTEQLDLIDTHIQRISATVRQLVSLARPATEHWELVDLRQTIKAALRLISFDRRARNISIAFECLAPLPRTFGLRDQLQQVFINLALNALDAMPDGGTLTIDVQAKRGTTVVRVEDVGCGIPAEAGRRIFEPFFTTKQPGEGTGFGLAVSYGIIQKHGGTIDFKSTVGKGTVFTVELPVLDKPPDAQHG